MERALDQALEPLERQRQVSSALRSRDRVHLVEDDGLDPAQRLARLRGQEQKERLRSRDEDVGRRAQHPASLVGRRVSRPHGDRELRVEPREGAAEIPLDVVVERLQRRHVEEAEPLAGRHRQSIDAEEERRERLSRAGRRLDEHVPAPRNGGPPELLRRRRRLERPLEPGPRTLREDVEGSHSPRVSVPVYHPKRARGALLHRFGRGQPTDRVRAARAPDRVRDRPAGHRPAGVLGTAQAEGADRHAGRARDRDDGSCDARGGVPPDARDPPLPSRDGGAGAGALSGRRRRVRRQRRADLDRGSGRGRPPRSESARSPATGR